MLRAARLAAIALVAAAPACAPRAAVPAQSMPLAVRAAEEHHPKEPSFAAASAVAPPAPEPPMPPPACGERDLVGCTNGCHAGRPEDCATLGALLLDGTIASIDVDGAIAAFRTACASQSARGCLRLGDAHASGLAKGDAEAAEAYASACRGGANRGCVAAGLAYRDGKGVAANAVLAASLFERVCEKGNADACLELGRIHEVGAAGLARDTKRAAQAFARGCQLGSAASCLYAERHPTSEAESAP